MQGKGKIFAFDADRRRLRRLKDNARATGADIIVPKCQDFLTVDPLEYPNVRF
jgi:putative methyltransferase